MPVVNGSCQWESLFGGEKSSVGTQRTSFTLCDLKAWINCVIYKYEKNYYFFSSMINCESCFPHTIFVIQ